MHEAPENIVRQRVVKKQSFPRNNLQAAALAIPLVVAGGMAVKDAGNIASAVGTTARNAVDTVGHIGVEPDFDKNTIDNPGNHVPDTTGVGPGQRQEQRETPNLNQSIVVDSQNGVPNKYFPTPSSAATPSGNVLTEHRQTVHEQETQALLDGGEAMKRLQEYFNNPQKFEAEHPDWVVKNRESGDDGLNFRKTPGAVPQNGGEAGNLDVHLAPHTPLNPLKGVAIKIGADNDGEWAIMYKDDPNGIKPVYFSVDNTQPIPQNPQLAQK